MDRMLQSTYAQSFRIDQMSLSGRRIGLLGACPADAPASCQPNSSSVRTSLPGEPEAPDLSNQQQAERRTPLIRPRTWNERTSSF